MADSFCIVFTRCRMIQIGMFSKYSQSLFYLLCKIKSDSFFTDREFHYYRCLTFQSCTNLLVHFSDLGSILRNKGFSHNTAGRSHICDTIYQNQLTQCSVPVKFVYNDLLREFQSTGSNLIFL